MQKNSITNKITPCCGLPFSVLYWWVSNLTLNSESDRQFIISKISQNGTISIDGWKVLVNSGTLEADASLTKSEFLAWFDCGKQPKCEQLKILIEAFKIGNWTPEGIQTIINNFYQYDIDDVVPSEALYNDFPETLAGDILKRVDKMTGENINYRIDSTKTMAEVDGLKYVDFNGVVYRNTNIDNEVKLKEIGGFAKLNLLSKIEFNTLLITEDINLNGNEYEIPNGLRIKFQGGKISNGKLKGNNTVIIADCVQIFDLSTELKGTWKSEKVWADWFGSIVNDYNSKDLVSSLDKLYPVFECVNLAKGSYFTNIGGVGVKQLVGDSMKGTIIDFRCIGSAKQCLTIGVPYGDASSRTFNSKITDLTISIGNPNGTRTKGKIGILVGATQKAILKNVRIMGNAEHMQMTEADLRELKGDAWGKMDFIPNIGVKFLGDSELMQIDNLFIFMDVGYSFRTGCDFITFNECLTAIGIFGFTSFYFDEKTYSNVRIESNSMNQGLHGVFFENSASALITNFTLSNSRIEQLNDIKGVDGKFLGCAFYSGWRSWLENINLENLMIPSISNGFDFKEVQFGYILLKNIGCIDVHDTQKDFGLQVNFGAGSTAKVDVFGFKFPTIKNVFDNFKTTIKTNGKFISNEKVSVDSLVAKNSVNGSIVADTRLVFDLDGKMRKKNEFTEIVIPKNNTDFINIHNSSFSQNSDGLKMKKIKVETFGNNYDFIEFVYKQGNLYDLIYQKNNSNMVVTSAMETERFNIYIDSSGILFLYNRTNEDLFCKVHSENIY